MYSLPVFLLIKIIPKRFFFLADIIIDWASGLIMTVNHRDRSLLKGWNPIQILLNV